MKIRLYLDEDSARHSLARELQARGTDVITVSEVGMGGRSDEQQLEWATSNSRALYSFNRSDFYRIHSEWMGEGKGHSGIILGTQQRYSVGEQTRPVK